MSPRTSTLLALIGVLLAGIPLPALTGVWKHDDEAPNHKTTAPATASPESCLPAYITVNCSGQPTELRLVHEGRELARLGPEELTQEWCSEFDFPANAPIALEVEAHWPQGSPRQAVTLTMEPLMGDARQDTGWTPPGSNTLHNLYIFPW